MGDLELWQTENYRQHTTGILFSRLHKLGVRFSLVDFEAYAKDYEIPEDMIEALTQQQDPLEQDQIYLLVFELWRRLFPEKRSLSIFCDELDYQMTLHDLEKSTSSVELQDALAYLQQILDAHVDQNIPPKQAFELIQAYCANDMESFLFDYILAEIEVGNQAYAIDLLDGFYRYFKSPLWFDYLRARTEILEDPEEGYEHFEKTIRKLGKEPPIELVEEMLYFLANTGNHSLFLLLATKFFTFMQNEVDFREFLEICYTHYDYLDLKQLAKTIADMFHKRIKNSPVSFSPQSDPDVVSLRKILKQKLFL